MASTTKRKKDQEMTLLPNNLPQNENNPANSDDSEERENANFDDELPGLKRRVTFPCDLVTSYCDPPNPWSGVPRCTTDELISAYRSSCERHEVRPIPIVLQQLKGIDLSICNDRYEMLSLRGNKLDCRHMETLEEIFRRVQFKNLDFEDTNMDDDTAISLFDMIEYYETCTRLNIALNSKISCRGWQICSRMMKKTPQLEVLDVRGILFVENYMPVLARSLRCGSMLRAIHMENCNISGRNLLILVSALKVNDHLIELFLANNKMVVSDGIQLGSLLKVNTTLQLLDLRNNSLGDEGVRHLSDGLYEQTKDMGGLATLILWSNGLTHIAMEYIASALSRCRHLQTLNLGYNNITNEGAHNLREGLLRNRSLLRLSLQAGKIGCEGAVALAEYIADTKQLMRLDLRENDIKTGGVIALALALKVNESISRLDLDPEIKKDSSIRDYAEQQREFRRQIDQRLTENRRLAQQREEQRLQEEQLRLEIESTSISSSDITLDGVREETLDSPCEPPNPEVQEDEPVAAKSAEPKPFGLLDFANQEIDPNAYQGLESCSQEPASPQLGSQMVHSPTDEVVSFLPPMQDIKLLSESDLVGAVSCAASSDEPNAKPKEESTPILCKELPHTNPVPEIVDVESRGDEESSVNHSNSGDCDDANDVSTDGFVGSSAEDIQRNETISNTERSVVSSVNHEDSHISAKNSAAVATVNSSSPSGDTRDQPDVVAGEQDSSIAAADLQQSQEVSLEDVNS